MSEYRFRTVVSAAIAAGLIASAAPALAQQKFDNASSHQQGRYGSKICFVTHHHYGESPSWPNKAGAQKAAIRHWVSFVIWEYGKRWGSYKMARGKRMWCDKSGSRWVCKTTAYPCRRR